MMQVAMQFLLFIAIVFAGVLLWQGNSVGLLGGGGKPNLTYEMPQAIQQSMSVAKAYEAIPHQRTTFNKLTASTMSKVDAEYLQQFFGLVDVVTVERMEQMHAGKFGLSGRPSNYMEILRRFDVLTPPETLKHMHYLVMHAIKEQNEYLQEWQKTGGKIDLYNALLQSSHRKLQRAYQLLMELYPKENDLNKQAFFDHLCALDFI